MKEEILLQMIAYNGADARRINHAIKVLGFASAIAKGEGLSPELTNIIEVAAILHDIGIHEAERKHNSCIGKYQEIEGPPIARQMLNKLYLEPEFTDRVCFLIGNHHSYQKIDGTDFQVLVEADFLVNIFEDEMQHIASLKALYFKTTTGIQLLESLYKERF